MTPPCESLAVVTTLREVAFLCAAVGPSPTVFLTRLTSFLRRKGTREATKRRGTKTTAAKMTAKTLKKDPMAKH